MAPIGGSWDRPRRRLTLILRLFVFAGFILSIYERNWLNALLVAVIVLTTYIPRLLRLRLSIRLLPEFEFLGILFVFASIFLGEIRDFYVRFWWWDMLLHAFSGLLLGLTGFVLVYAMNREEKIELSMKPGFVALFAFAFALAGGAIWEIFEFAMDEFFGLNMQKSGLVDTMWDLIVDATTALAMSVFGYVYLKSPAESIVERWTADFIRANPAIFGKGDLPKDSPNRGLRGA